MKRIIVALLLLALIGGAAAGALYFQGETGRLHDQNRALVTAAEDRLARAKEELSAIDPSTVEGEERQLASEQAIVADANARAEALEAENAELDKSIEEAQTALEAAMAEGDNAYYMTVYDSLSQGMQMVEGYIEGN